MTVSDLLEIQELRIELPVQGRPQPVIQDVSLAVREGEAVGLVGESGAGKSMTSRAVIRLLPPGAVTSGQILFDSIDVLGLGRDALRRYRAADVAMIFQDPRTHVNPVRRIGDFLTEALVTNGVCGRDEAAERVVELLQDVGIDDAPRRLRQYPHELSGGLLQRVMIAAALAVEPRLLLADEPTTSLDVTTQAEVMAILDDQRRSRRLTMLFVTHDLELAVAVCDRIAVMYAGFLVEDRSAAALHETARHPYTAGLLASRPSPTTRAPRLWAIPGRPLSAYEVRWGCPFASRCPFVVDRCRDETQVMRAVDGGLVRCWRAEELRGRLAEGYERELGELGARAELADEPFAETQPGAESQPEVETRPPSEPAGPTDMSER
ncbi:MAG TPA: ABC transporter ATP-binding protein [Thermoleophilia bacterium]|nr:ABC transporter ATP-binding protein [Thermoleophilia bacterium]